MVTQANRPLDRPPGVTVLAEQGPRHQRRSAVGRYAPYIYFEENDFLIFSQGE